MKTFTDNIGRTWTVQINVDAIKRVRDLVGTDLLTIIEGTLLEQLSNDPILLCNVIFCVCKKQADEKNITDTDFGRSMSGDAIEGATSALLEELIDFFPHGRRKVLKTALAKLKKLQEMALESIQADLESPKLEETLTAQLKTLGSSSGNAPESSDSTPAG